MVALLLLIATAFQDRPAILDIRTLTDDHVRSGCWIPLKVRVGGPAGAAGELVATSDAGFTVARPFTIAAGGTSDVILPGVALATDAKIEVLVRRDGKELARRDFKRPLKFLDRQRLVLVDPGHPESEAFLRESLTLKDGTRIVFASSDPQDWNEAGRMGALESADGVIVSPERASDLRLEVWRALGGAVTSEPRRDLLDLLQEPVARFPVIDGKVGRFTVGDAWIPKKREATTLFLVIYAFAFFVAVFLTWSRKGGAVLLLVAALGVTGLFAAAYSAVFPKGNLAVRSWQAMVDAPETKVTVSVSALWGSGKAGRLSFGPWVKPVFSTRRDADRGAIEMRCLDDKWEASGVSPGDPVRFVSVSQEKSLDPYAPYLDETGEAVKYKPAESEYYLRIPRKRMIRLQDPATGIPPAVSARGLVEHSLSRVFRLELLK